MLTAVVTGVITGCLSAWFTVWYRDHLDRGARHQRWLLDKRARAVEDLIGALGKCVKELSDYHRTVYLEAQHLPFREPDAEFARNTLEPLRDRIGRTQNQWAAWFAYDLRRMTAWFEQDEKVFKEVSEIGHLAWTIYENLYMLAEHVRQVKESGAIYTDERFKEVAEGPRSSLPRMGQQLSELNKQVARYQRELVTRLKGTSRTRERAKRYRRLRRRTRIGFWRGFDKTVRIVRGMGGSSA